MSHSEYVEEKFVSREEKIYTVVIIYDVTDNKRRNRLAKLLEGYGVRVQKSAFEARLTKRNYSTMLGQAKRIIDTESDSLKTYLLPNRTGVRSSETETDCPQDVIII